MINAVVIIAAKQDGLRLKINSIILIVLVILFGLFTIEIRVTALRVPSMK
jgi:hypothetical protein